MESNILTTTLADYVKQDFHAAAVFEKYGLDFCCRGKRPIGDACKDKNIDPEKVIEELNMLRTNGSGKTERFDTWELDFLVDYIVNKHHSYVKEMLPTLSFHTQKIMSVHGDRHPELIKIAHLFAQVKTELDQHLVKEEQILFPYVKALAHAKKRGEPFPPNRFGTVMNPIAMMEQEHDAVGQMCFSIRELSSDYTPPPDGCTTYQITFKELKEFEEDLHQHIHLENNILFPKAIALEEEIQTA